MVITVLFHLEYLATLPTNMSAADTRYVVTTVVLYYSRPAFSTFFDPHFADV